MTVALGASLGSGAHRESFRPASLLAGLLAGTCLMPLSAMGQTNNWIGTSPPYANPANWQNAAIPLSSETAVFSTLGTSRTVAIGVGTSVGGWQFAAGAPGYTFTVSNSYQFLSGGIVDLSSTAPIVQVAGSGTLLFSNSSTAGDAALRNTAATARITFQNSSTAGTATISNTFAGAALAFQDSASAGSATITNGSGNTIAFTGSASAGSATITNSGSIVTFAGSTTAGSATINNNSGTVAFSGSATAGTATITNSGALGKSQFTGTSTGGQARLITSAGGVVDISGLSSSGMTAGSIEGSTGSFRLGSKQLTAGGNNLSTTFGGSITDSGDFGGTGGSLVKTGTGTLILTGNSTYTGGTTISGGTLQLGNGTTTGSITGNIVNNGALVFNQSSQATFSNAISGTGSVQQASANNSLLILTGANTYTGGTTVSSGALQLGLAGISGTSIAGAITNNATLQFVNVDTTAMTSVTTTGPGVTAFFGTTSAGTATITTNSGGFTGFRANSTGGQAQFVTNAGGTVDISGLASSGMAAGSIAGAGSYNLGSKQLTVGGNNLSTTVSGVIADGGLLGGTGGSLFKTGTGTLTLSGANTFTGGTTVNQGTLIVNGSLASTVTLSGGSLGGSGTVAGLTANNATIAPGNSIGTLTVAGNLVQNGGTYQVETNASGQSDRLNVSGSATINGANVQVLAQSGSYARYTTYTILNATGGVLGTYSGVSSNFAFLTPTLSYDTNNVYLTLFQNQSAFAAGAQTANQYAVGAVLDQVNAGATGDLNDVLNALSVLSNSQGPAALDAISGQPYADFGTTNLQGANLFMSAVGQQMAAARGTASTGQRQALAQACDIDACEGATPWTAWAGALGGLGSVAGNGNASTLTYNFGGGATGIDYRIDPRFLVGFGAGYAAGNQWVDSFMGRGWSDTVSATVYGSFTQSEFYANALAGYAYSANQMQRQIVIPGLQPRLANGNTGANQFFGQVETGYRVAVFAPAPLSVTPFARLQAATVTQNGFSESGSAQSLALNVAPQTTNSLRTTLGATLAGSFELTNHRALDVALRLGWLHEFADTSRPITAALAGAPYNAFTVYGASPQRDSAALGFSAATQVAEAVQAYLRYDGDVNSTASNHALTAGVRFTW
jgi:outer membrane autotransporter protein